MRKNLLILIAIVAAALSFNTNAMTPLTAEELDKFDIQLDYYNSGSTWFHAGSVVISYVNGDNTKIQIEDFYNRGTRSSIVSGTIDWETGTITWQAGKFNENTQTGNYFGNYFMPADVVEQTGRHISNYTSRTLKGSISAERITIDDEWAVVGTEQEGMFFTREVITGYGIATSGSITTRFVKSNATQTQEEWNGTSWETKSYRVYIEQDFSRRAEGIVPTYIYSVNGSSNCMVMELNRNGLAADADHNNLDMSKGQKVYGMIFNNKEPIYNFNQYVGQLNGSTWTKNTTDDITGYSTAKEIHWNGTWVVYNDGNMERQGNVVGVYRNTVFTIDGDNNVVTAIDDVNTDAAKTEQSVVYYNLNGQSSIEPWQGVNVKVVTYTDGTKKSSKIVK